MGYQRRIATLRSEGLGGSVPDSFDRSLVRLRPFRDYLDDGLAMIGSPDEVRDRLQEYLEATGYQHVLLLMALPGLGTAEALRSMRLFAEEVQPAMKPLAQRGLGAPDSRTHHTRSPRSIREYSVPEGRRRHAFADDVPVSVVRGVRERGGPGPR